MGLTSLHPYLRAHPQDLGVAHTSARLNPSARRSIHKQLQFKQALHMDSSKATHATYCQKLIQNSTFIRNCFSFPLCRKLQTQKTCADRQVCGMNVISRARYRSRVSRYEHVTSTLFQRCSGRTHLCWIKCGGLQDSRECVKDDYKQPYKQPYNTFSCWTTG